MYQPTNKRELRVYGCNEIQSLCPNANTVSIDGTNEQD